MTRTGSTEPAVAAAGGLQRRQGETGADYRCLVWDRAGTGRLFAGDGAELVLVARREGRLRELAGELAAEYGVQAQVVAADLGQPAGPGEIIEALAQQDIEVDVLVNNAGFEPTAQSPESASRGSWR